TVWTLTGLVLLACWKIQAIRDWMAIIDLGVLIALHLIRFVGIYFLILGQRGQLPKAFAQPAGIGDIMVASLAVVLLAFPRVPRWRTFLRLWNFFGLIDIVFVAFAALRSG